MLVLVSVFLFGSNLCAQDWSKFIGAKEIIDDMKASEKAGMSLEEAVDSKWDVYSDENTAQLISLSKLDYLPLSECTDYLTRAKAVVAERKADKWDVRALEIAADEADKKLSEKPIRSLLGRLHKFNDFFDDAIFQDTRTLDMPLFIKGIGKALLFFSGKGEFDSEDFPVILGTFNNGNKDGLLYEAAKIEKEYSSTMPQLPKMWEPLIQRLQLKVLCDCTAVEQILGFIELSKNSYGDILGETFTNRVSSKDFSLENTELIKIVGKDALDNGIENLNKITELTKVIEK